MHPKHKYDHRRRYLRYLCRCSRLACQARRTFKSHPGYFQKPRYCQLCGSAKWRIDWYRMQREKKLWMKTCRCAAAHYPHRQSWCEKLHV